MKTALSRWLGPVGVSASVRAEAQARQSPDASWKPTVHIYELPFQRLDGLIKKPDEPLRQQMDGILSDVASSIWETYSPKK